MSRYKTGSILQSAYNRGCCYLCMILERDFSEKPVLHKHHIFMGPLRRISEEQGFFVWLCPECHMTGPHAVHKDYHTCRQLQRLAQEEYERDHTREEFMDMIGRSFL